MAGNHTYIALQVLTGEMKWSDVQMSVTSSDDAVSVHSNLILTINSLDMKVHPLIESNIVCLTIRFVHQLTFMQIEALSNVNGYDLTIVLKIKQITGCDIRLSPYQQASETISRSPTLHAIMYPIDWRGGVCFRV